MDIREEVKRGIHIFDLPLRVCFYARVSTDHELQFTSILNQVDYFKKYIDHIPCWKLVGNYIDEGISGKGVSNRVQFLKMIEDGRNHKFDLVLTKSVSRFARNTIDSIRYTDLLLSYGIGVLFVNDNINTFDGDSEFRLTLMASIAQDELRKLSESVKFGLKQSIQRGVVLGNNNILGYKKEVGTLVVVPEEAKIIQDIFLWFSSGNYTYAEVGRMIFNKYHRHFDSTGIKRILMNYKYKGYYCGRKSEVIDYKNSKRKKIEVKDWVLYRDYEKVPPIVKEEVWDRVHSIIQKRNQARRKNKLFCNYQDRVFCVVHQRKLDYKVKYYKKKSYGYLICPKCCSLSLLLVDRIWKIHSFEKMWVFPWEEMVLKIECQ